MHGSIRPAALALILLGLGAQAPVRAQLPDVIRIGVLNDMSTQAGLLPGRH